MWSKHKCFGSWSEIQLNIIYRPIYLSVIKHCKHFKQYKNSIIVLKNCNNCIVIWKKFLKKKKEKEIADTLWQSLSLDYILMSSKLGIF